MDGDQDNVDEATPALLYLGLSRTPEGMKKAGEVFREYFRGP